MNKEIWKDVVGYEGLYQVSNFGNVKSLSKIHYIRQNSSMGYLSKERILKPILSHNGYLLVKLSKNGKTKNFRINRLVIESFLPDKSTFKSMPDEDRKNIDLDELKVNHKDENIKNNNISNLEWCTHKYNMNYGTINERRRKRGK